MNEMANQFRIRHVLRMFLAVLSLHFLATLSALAQHTNDFSVSGSPSAIVASDSPLAAYQGFVYAVAEDHKHLLRKSVAPGSWRVFETNTNFSNIRGLTSVNSSATLLKSTSSGSPLGNLYVADAGDIGRAHV